MRQAFFCLERDQFRKKFHLKLHELSWAFPSFPNKSMVSIVSSPLRPIDCAPPCETTLSVARNFVVELFANCDCSPANTSTSKFLSTKYGNQYNSSKSPDWYFGSNLRSFQGFLRNKSDFAWIHHYSTLNLLIFAGLQLSEFQCSHKSFRSDAEWTNQIDHEVLIFYVKRHNIEMKWFFGLSNFYIGSPFLWILNWVVS